MSELGSVDALLFQRERFRHQAGLQVMSTISPSSKAAIGVKGEHVQFQKVPIIVERSRVTSVISDFEIDSPSKLDLGLIALGRGSHECEKIKISSFYAQNKTRGCRRHALSARHQKSV